MKQNVTIKGTKSGIILVLDPIDSFELIKIGVEEKFKEASSFLGRANMGLLIRGRDLSDEEEAEVVSIIEANSLIKISCIVNEDAEVEKVFAGVPQSAAPASEPVVREVSADAVPQVVSEVFDASNARIFSGNLRSGQDISCPESIVVLGDVKPGATVTSYGSIFILGELRGNAFAGASGDNSAVVMALDLNPLQIRIAEAIAISPDAEKGPKLKLKKKRLMSNGDKEPEVAYIENGHIVKSLYGPSFLRQFYKN